MNNSFIKYVGSRDDKIYWIIKRILKAHNLSINIYGEGDFTKNKDVKLLLIGSSFTTKLTNYFTWDIPPILDCWYRIFKKRYGNSDIIIITLKNLTIINLCKVLSSKREEISKYNNIENCMEGFIHKYRGSLLDKDTKIPVLFEFLMDFLNLCISDFSDRFLRRCGLSKTTISELKRKYEKI